MIFLSRTEPPAYNPGLFFANQQHLMQQNKERKNKPVEAFFATTNTEGIHC
jgi:hypothetical protein